MTHIQDALFPDDAITGSGQPTPWPLPIIRPLNQEQDADEDDPNQEALPFGELHTGDAA
jgi:hypothetical protein